MTADHKVIAKVGRLTSGIRPGGMGEVMLPIRGGSEVYFAYAADPTEEIPKGTRVIVIEHDQPRTVIVSRYPSRQRGRRNELLGAKHIRVRAPRARAAKQLAASEPA